MKIRNIPYKELNEKERKIVKKHFDSCMNDKTLVCHKLHKSDEDFWETHREIDTDNGIYDGWIE